MSERNSIISGLGRVAAATLLGLFVVACGSSDKPQYVERPVEELYNGAMNAMQAGDYDGNLRKIRIAANRLSRPGAASSSPVSGG